jgi:hypothetical protein
VRGTDSGSPCVLIRRGSRSKIRRSRIHGTGPIRCAAAGRGDRDQDPGAARATRRSSSMPDKRVSKGKAVTTMEEARP